MKILLLITLCFLNWNKTHSQILKQKDKEMCSKLEKFYNSSQYDQIFSLFTGEMKSFLSLEKTKDFFSVIKSDFGNIIKSEFVEYLSLSAHYKTTFEKGICTIDISVNNDREIAGLLIKPYIPSDLPKPERNTTKLYLPFKGEWSVIWGGDTRELNYHVESAAQKNAFDFLITDKQGRSYRSSGKVNEDYYSFGQPIIAPCNGEVVQITEGINDNIPGILNPSAATGNSIILKTNNNEFLLFAHFMKKSIKVRQGQKIKQGQLLGLCGNSGNSSEPHLHFHVQNVMDMKIATGIKCYFTDLIVNEKKIKEYSPLRGEKVRSQ